MDTSNNMAQDKQSSAAPPAPAKRQSWTKRVLIDLVIGYALLCLLVFFMQKRLVYQPARETNLAPESHGFAPQQARAIETQTRDGVTLRGWHVSARGGKSLSLEKAELVDLFFCGNAGHRGDRYPTFLRLAGYGADVVCFDYRGYGDSEGSPHEEGLALDARAAWDYLRAQGVPANRIVVHGESLGGAVATRLASELSAEGTPPAALILEATFPRMRAVAARHYFYLPVRLLLTQNFPSVERIPKLTCPLLQFHGVRDTLIPLALGRELFAAAPEKSSEGIEKVFIELPDCDHNSIGIVNAEAYREPVKSLYQTLAPALKPSDRERAPGEVQKRERRRRPDREKEAQ